MENSLENIAAKCISIEVLAKQVVEGFITGLHKSPYHGFSVEFAEHRAYNPGDSVRHIDWKLWGRTDKMFVKRYEEETNLRCSLIIDVSSSMYYAGVKEKKQSVDKISFSVYAAACLIELLTKQRDAVGVSFISDTLEWFSEVKSTHRHKRHLFAELESYLNKEEQRKGKTGKIAETIHLLAEQIHKRSLVIIFSDMLEGAEDMELMFSAFRHLKHKKHEILLFHIQHHSEEFLFDFPDRPYHFVDMETGEKIKLLPNQIREEYVRFMKNFSTEFKHRCEQYGIDYVEANVENGLHSILEAYLLKRKRLY